MSYNPAILKGLLTARSISYDELSRRLKLSPDQLQAELSRDPEPGQGILRSIAEELACPPFVFFMDEMPNVEGRLPDFRSTRPVNTPKTRSTTETIQLAEGIQNTAEELGAPAAHQLPTFAHDLTDAQIDDFAFRVRIFFGITLEDQGSARDARAFYILCRKRIEDKGIYVLQDSFPDTDGSGFCLAHANQPIIVINTKRQSHARRLFTLAHELAHILMGLSGISDPFVSHNRIERSCNRFAGSFLAPPRYVSALLGGRRVNNDPDPDEVKWASRRLKISHEATALRLVQLGIYKHGTYEKWKALTHNFNPDWKDKSGGPPGVTPAQEKIKLARYGFRFAKTFDSLLSRGLITDIRLYRASGLKPKYQGLYFGYTRSIQDHQLRTLELGDE